MNLASLCFSGVVLSRLVLVSLLYSILPVSRGLEFTTVPSNLTVQEQKEALFFCAVDVPDVTITWYVNDQKVTMKRHNFVVTSGSGRSTLEVLQAKRKDQGPVVCRISTSQSDEYTLSSQQAYLNVVKGRVPEGFPQCSISSTLQVFEVERQMVLLFVVTGSPSPLVLFTKDQMPIDDKSHSRMKVFTTDEGNYIIQVDRTLEVDSGKYRCIATNELGTSYSPVVQVYAKKRLLPPFFSILPENEDVLPGSNVELTCVAVGSPMPQVKWLNGSQELNEIQEGRNVLELKNVQVSSNLTCVAYSELGEITHVVNLRVKVSQKGPENLRASTMTSSSVHLEWSLMDGDFQNAVFHLSYQPITNGSKVDDVTKRETQQTQITLTDLRPFTEYMIQVELHCDDGVSRPTSIKITTLEAAPSSPPQMVRASPVSWNSISVLWEEPSEANGIIRGYKVYCEENADNPQPSRTMKTVANRSVLFGNLHPNKVYKISVKAFTNAGDGPSSEAVSILMQEKATPEPPEGLRVDSRSSKTVGLTWQRSISSDVTDYVVDGRPIGYGDDDGELIANVGSNSSVSVPSALNSHLVENLLPGVVYEFKVAAKSPRGLSSYSRPIEVETHEEVPSSPPENLHAEALDSTTIRVIWKPISKGKRNGKILGYRVLHSTLESTKNDREEDLERMDTGVTINVPYPEHSWVLRDLPVWSRHKFKVTGYTSAGDGPWSQPALVRTFEDVPGVPRRLRVTVQSSTSVLVTWRPPLEQNGLIQGYQVFYLELDKNEQIVGNPMIKDVESGSKDEIFIDGLKAGTSYDFQVAAYTRRGDGPRSKPKRVKTTVPAFGPPENVHLTFKQHNPSRVLATWDAPHKSSGTSASVQGYKVLYQARDTSDENVEELIIGEDTREALTKPLSNGMEYEFQVMAKSLNEYGPPALASVYVPEGKALAVPEMLSLKRLSPSTAFLAWKPLRQENWNDQEGEYRVKLKEKDALVEEILTSHSSSTELTLNNLKPNVTYDIQMSSCMSSECSAWSQVMELKPLRKTGTSAKSSNLLEAPSAERMSSATALVKLKGNRSEMRNGTYYLVVVGEDLASRRNPNSFSTLELLRESEDAPIWICRQFSASHFPTEFLVGDEKRDHHFINHKLNLDNFSYRFFVRLRTDRDEEFSSEYSHPLGTPLSHGANLVGFKEDNPETPASSNLFIIIISVFMSLLLAAFVILTAVFVKKRTRKVYVDKKQKDYKKIYRSNTDASEVPLNPRGLIDPDGNPYITTMTRAQRVVPIHQLADKVEELKRNDRELLRNEYESIDSEKQFTWLTSNQEQNRHKNRYANVVAYDHSRVVLQPLGYPGSDYVNANYIDGLSNKQMYIATQGPMPETFEDFWRMVWECNCSTIVMITKLEERNRIKCDCYWPQHGSEVYGRMQVSLKDVLDLASYTIRTFTISVRDFLETREVFQLQFTSWPDHGVPEYPTLLLQFIKRVRTANSIHGGPITVHCSAGVGRTGTMIAIDISLDHMVQFGTVDILGCVTKLRSQRNYMVQSDDQYQFIYEAILEAASSPGDTEVPADQLSAYIQDLKSVDGKSGISKLSSEYQKLSIIQYDQSQFQNANLPFNKNKNRSNGIQPLDSNRVCLQPIRGVDGSDYINASFVDGYKNQQSYIATQYPLNDTINDFWRMVWEQNTSIIVMLANHLESGIELCNQYWPDDRSMRYQYFVLDPITTMNIGQYYIREFKMTDARDGQSRIIYHFQFVDWLHTGREFSASGQQFINFIGQVENMRGKMGSGGPIAVHCPTGAGRTGVFVALSYLLERMRTEGVVNLFETAKILRTQRPFMIQTEEQYSFCYQAASEYLTSFDHYTK